MGFQKLFSFDCPKLVEKKPTPSIFKNRNKKLVLDFCFSNYLAMKFFLGKTKVCKKLENFVSIQNSSTFLLIIHFIEDKCFGLYPFRKVSKCLCSSLIKPRVKIDTKFNQQKKKVVVFYSTFDDILC